jgi:hypothetical protein
MSLIHIDRNPSRRWLAWFGLIWLVVFGAIACSAFLRHGWTASAAAFLGLAVIVPAAGWVCPPLMRAVYLTVAYATLPIGLAVTFVVMAAVYYLVLTPLGRVLRACGHDAMHRRFEPGAESYWADRPEQPAVERYFRQF